MLCVTLALAGAAKGIARAHDDDVRMYAFVDEAALPAYTARQRVRVASCELRVKLFAEEGGTCRYRRMEDFAVQKAGVLDGERGAASALGAREEQRVWHIFTHRERTEFAEDVAVADELGHATSVRSASSRWKGGKPPSALLS